jgi:hypothetical protein
MWCLLCYPGHSPASVETAGGPQALLLLLLLLLLPVAG